MDRVSLSRGFPARPAARSSLFRAGQAVSLGKDLAVRGARRRGGAQASRGASPLLRGTSLEVGRAAAPVRCLAPHSRAGARFFGMFTPPAPQGCGDVPRRGPSRARRRGALSRPARTRSEPLPNCVFMTRFRHPPGFSRTDRNSFPTNPPTRGKMRSPRSGLRRAVHERSSPGVVGRSRGEQTSR